jgi:SAM-dependent methyltransferase
MSHELWAVYDEMAAHYETHVAGHAYNAHYDRPAVLELVGDVAGRRVLDAGCGPGLYAEELVARGAEVVAFDASTAMVELARARLGERADIRHAILGQPLPFADTSFDLVVCALTIHYVENRAEVFAEFQRVLRPGGRVVLSTHHPTREWLDDDGHSYFDVYLHDDHWRGDDETFVVRYWRFPLGVLCEEIASAGLVIELLVETRPAASMLEVAPDAWAKLQREPGFLALALHSL